MAIITVYKMGQSTKINDFDLASYKKQGWSTSQSAAPATSAPKTTTPAPAPAPASSTAKPTGNITIYKNGESTQIPAGDFSVWQKKGWSQTASSPAPSTSAPKTATPAPTATPASSTTPPAGATYISNPNDLKGLTESQIWRSPDGRIYKLANSTPTATPMPTATPTKTTTPVTTATPSTSSSLNTSGLLEAYSRKQAGTATATDLANLDYAMGKGWTPPSSASTTPAASSTATSGGTQTTGGQDIPGLNTNGLAEAYARKVAGTANATDLANLDYAEGKGWKPPSVTSTPVTDPKTANDIINSQQNADIAAKSTSDEPTVRSTTGDIMDYVKKQITPTTEAPVAPNFEKALTDLNKQYGVSELQTTLNDLQDTQRQLAADYTALYGREHGKTVAMNVIEGRITEEERQASERLTNLNNAIASVSDQLNTANSTISSIMQTKQLDYNTASAAYKAEMDQNISLFNAAQGIEQSLKTDAQNAIDNARSSAQILVNGFSTAGLTFADLTPTQQAQLKQLSVQSGFDPGFYEAVLSVTKDVQKDILTSIISDDKMVATIIYKDGTTATIPTGQSASHNTPANPAPKDSEDKDYQKFLDDAASLVAKLDSGDISWSTAWDQLHIKYPSASPELIDSKLGGGKAYQGDNGTYLDANGNPIDATALNDQGYYGRGQVVKAK